MESNTLLQYIDQNQLITYQEMFSIFDKEDTGLMPTSQLPLFIRGLGHCPTESDLKQMLEKLDPNEEGTVSFTSVVETLVKRKKQSNIEDELLEAFEGIQNEIGGGGSSDTYKMSIHGVKKYLTDLGESLSQVELEQFLQFLEENNLKEQTDFNFRDFAKILAYGYLE